MSKRCFSNASVKQHVWLGHGTLRPSNYTRWTVVCDPPQHGRVRCEAEPYSYRLQPHDDWRVLRDDGTGRVKHSQR